MRLINADALKKNIIKRLGIKGYTDLLPAEKAIYDQIDNEPPIEERKKGKSIVKSTGYRGYWMCDQCGTEIKSTDNFCRNCGADLRGELK